jgi:NAD(P)-dependent dehydrogenase (short-subunit alcohol dehydrogenase family)
MPSIRLNRGFAIVIGVSSKRQSLKKQTMILRLELIIHIQAASGIGRETSLILAEAGAAGVLLADINEAGAREAVEESKTLATDPNYQAFAVKVDVTDATSVKSMVDRAVEKFGRIDYCVNSAGVSYHDRLGRKPFWHWLLN